MEAFAFKSKRVAMTLKTLAEDRIHGAVRTQREATLNSTRPRILGRRSGWVEMLADLPVATVDGSGIVIPSKANAQVMFLTDGTERKLKLQKERYSDGALGPMKRPIQNDSLTASFKTGDRLFVHEDQQGDLWISPGSTQGVIGTLTLDCPPDSIATLTQQIDDGGGNMTDGATIIGYNVHPITWKAGLLMKATKMDGWGLPLVEPWEWKDCAPTPAGSMAFSLADNGGVGEPLDGTLNGVATYPLDGRYWHSTPGTPVDLTMDPATGQVVINTAGRYSMTIQIGFVHNTSTSRERVAQIAVYDTVAAGVVGNPGLIGVARNTESTTYSTTILLDATNVPTSPLMLQMGGGGAGVEEIGAVEIFSLGWTLVKI